MHPPPVLQVFDRTAGNAVVGTIAGLSRGVFSVDWSADKMLAVAGGDCAVRLFKVDDAVEESKGDEADVLMAAPVVKPRATRRVSGAAKTSEDDESKGEAEHKSGGDSESKK